MRGGSKQIETANLFFVTSISKGCDLPGVPAKPRQVNTWNSSMQEPQNSRTNQALSCTEFCTWTTFLSSVQNPAYPEDVGRYPTITD